MYSGISRSSRKDNSDRRRGFAAHRRTERSGNTTAERTVLREVREDRGCEGSVAVNRIARRRIRDQRGRLSLHPSRRQPRHELPLRYVEQRHYGERHEEGPRREGLPLRRYSPM